MPIHYVNETLLNPTYPFIHTKLSLFDTVYLSLLHYFVDEFLIDCFRNMVYILNRDA
ncbi:hypothetical protein KSU1_C0470 [Candidatus Jettenia caeni]|uniref:Uncharacterized protein n=1 Tax=Candidatus Jettenia caeni TaxID=247490 RepID=I3IK21_9BACT|nr:hypothetical protein KSU1_C0470 [Candidatus Jettenia caeni]